jgi:hypothetical protein
MSSLTSNISNKSVVLKQYLDIFGDWYYTKEQTSNKSRALGIDTLSNFFDKYRIKPEDRTAVLDKFSAIFGRDYLFGSSNDVQVCRPMQIKEIIPYLNNRIETIKDDIKTNSIYGRSVYLSRLESISKNIKNYVTLMESSNSESLQLCEDIKLRDTTMSSEEMLSYLVKVLYYGLYPKEASDNIKKCVNDFRILPENDLLKKLVSNIKKKDTDGIIEFLKLVSVVVTSIPKDQASDIKTIREHLTYIFDRLSSDVGKNAFVNNSELLDQLKDALSKISADDIAKSSSEIISPDFKSLIEKLATENIEYDDDIKNMIDLLAKNDFKGFVTAVKSYKQAQIPPEVKRRMDAVISQLKKEKDDEIAAEIKQQAQKAQYQVKKMYDNPLFKGKIPPPIDKGMFDIISKLEKALEESKKKDVDIDVLKNKIVELETEIRVFGDNINALKGELEQKSTLIEQLKTVEKADNKIKYIARIFKGIEQSGLISPDNKVILTEAIKLLNKDILTADDINRLDHLLTEAIIPTVSDEELDAIMNDLELRETIKKYDANVKDILESIKLFKQFISRNKESTINSINHNIREIDELERNIKERERLLNDKAKEYELNKKHNYLNILIKLTTNPDIKSAMIKQIASKYSNLSKTNENIMSNLQNELGIPDDIKISDIFDEILNIFSKDVLAGDLLKEMNNMSKDQIHRHLYNLSIIILYLSSAIPSGIIELEGMSEDMINTIKLLEGEEKFMYSEKVLAYINDIYYILSLPFKMNDSTITKNDLINEVELNKTIINIGSNEINTNFNKYDESIRDELRQTMIYSKYQIISIFITLLKIYYKKENSNISPAALFGNNVFEEEPVVKPEEVTEYANNFESYAEPEEKYEGDWHNEGYNNSQEAEEVPYNEGVEGRDFGEEDQAYSKVKYRNLTAKNENISPAGLFGNNNFEEEPSKEEPSTLEVESKEEEYPNNFESYIEPEEHYEGDWHNEGYNNSGEAEEVPYNEGVEGRNLGEEDQLYSKIKYKNLTAKEENVSPAGLFGNNNFEEEPERLIKPNTTIDKKRIYLKELLLNKNPANQARAYERNRILSAVGCIRGNDSVLSKLCSDIKQLISKYDEFTVYDDIIDAIIDAYVTTNKDPTLCNKLFELYIYEILLAIDYITTKYEVSKGCGIGDDPVLKENYNKLIEHFMIDDKTFLDHYELKKPKKTFPIPRRFLKKRKEEVSLPSISKPAFENIVLSDNDDIPSGINQYDAIISGKSLMDTGVKTSAASSRKISTAPMTIRSPFVSGRSTSSGQQDIIHNSRILEDAYRRDIPYTHSEFDELHNKLKTRSAKRDLSEIQRTLTYKAARKQGGTKKALTRRKKNNK